MRRHPSLTITRTKGGTYTIHLERPGQPPERWRTGVPDEAEARSRCAVVAELCGYRVAPVVREL